MMGWWDRLAPQYRIPQATVFAAPFIAERVHTSSFVWPPLGNLEAFVVPVAMGAIGLCSLLPTMIQTKGEAKSWLKVTVVASIVLFAMYAVLVGGYVVSVTTPANGVQTRSVGFRVEPRIHAQFPEANNEQLLRIGGLDEWQIKKVWTPGSVLALRLTLLATFSAFFCLSNIAIGSARRFTMKRK